MSVARVLVVDDDPWILRMVTATLERKNYAVDTARDGKQALQRAQSARPNLIITDVMMPVMDGWTFVQQLRSIPHLTDVPVIFLTALGRDEGRLSALGLGPKDFISKPFRFDELDRRVSEALAAERATSSPAAPPGYPGGPPPAGGYPPQGAYAEGAYGYPPGGAPGYPPPGYAPAYGPGYAPGAAPPAGPGPYAPGQAPYPAPYPPPAPGQGYPGYPPASAGYPPPGYPPAGYGPPPAPVGLGPPARPGPSPDAPLGGVSGSLGSAVPPPPEATSDRVRRTTALNGRLEQLGLSSLLVMMEMERKDGVLSLQDAATQRVGRIFLRKGQVICARVDGDTSTSGRESVYAMLAWSRGTFSFSAMEVDMEDTVASSTTHLLMEGARLMDESNRGDGGRDP